MYKLICAIIILDIQEEGAWENSMRVVDSAKRQKILTFVKSTIGFRYVY